MAIVSTLKKLARRLYDRDEAFLRKLRKQGAKIGTNVQIVDRFRFLYEPWYADLIELKDGVVISAGVRFVQHDSSYSNIVGDLPVKFGRIVVGTNSYVGVNSIILPGVTIGDHSLVGAGSVVNRDIPSNSIAVGNPARVIGSVTDGVERFKADANKRDNGNLWFLDFGGSYSQLKSRYGKKTTDVILRKYQQYRSNRDLR
ncbi:MAG: acyltransferase [Nitrososphaerota archaeon]|nr:acyltransferase [Nitrososphaerota archaeon]